MPDSLPILFPVFSRSSSTGAFGEVTLDQLGEQGFDGRTLYLAATCARLVGVALLGCNRREKARHQILVAATQRIRILEDDPDLSRVQLGTIGVAKEMAKSTQTIK